MSRDLLSSSAEVSAQACEPWSLRRPRVTIVMGLDQHRAQITAEWLDTETGEVSRARVAPADREPVAAVPAPLRGARARGRVGGDDGLAVRGRGAAARSAPGASGRAGGDRRAAREQEAREERSRGRPASARAVDGRAAAGVVDPARSPARSARAGPAAPHAGPISAASGSSGSRRCSTTTAARSGAS